MEVNIERPTPQQFRPGDWVVNENGSLFVVIDASGLKITQEDGKDLGVIGEGEDQIDVSRGRPKWFMVRVEKERTELTWDYQSDAYTKAEEVSVNAKVHASRPTASKTPY